MTEKQGGSDVRANTTRAEPTGVDDAWGREFRLTGHKWFCSAPMSDAFLVLAQAPGGLSCFFVPRVLPDGTRNVFRIQRLKDKLGNRSNASSEIELDRTAAWLVGDEGRGVATIVQMVTRTRLDCVIGSAAGMRQSVAEAAWHVRHRNAFGALLIDQPAMTAVVADLALDSEAATLTAMRLARAYDDDAAASGSTDVPEQAFRRLATAVAKYWICKRGPGHAYEALECLGGNGYTEAFPLARRYREQPLLAIWEGSGNVIALDVLRVLAREPEAFEAFFDVVGEAAGEHAAFDLALAEARAVVGEGRGRRHKHCRGRACSRTHRAARARAAGVAARAACARPRRRRVRAHPPRGRRRVALRRTAAGRRHRGDPRAGVSRGIRSSFRGIGAAQIALVNVTRCSPGPS